MDDRIEERLGTFSELCRRERISCTHQRREILRELAGARDHPSAEAIYERVRGRLPAISLDTVYRTLHFFEEKGLIQRLGSAGDRGRFDADVNPHAHFVCSICGRLADLHGEAIDRLALDLRENEQGTVDYVYIECKGVCHACRNARKQTSD